MGEMTSLAKEVAIQNHLHWVYSKWLTRGVDVAFHVATQRKNLGINMFILKSLQAEFLLQCAVNVWFYSNF